MKAFFAVFLLIASLIKTSTVSASQMKNIELWCGTPKTHHRSDFPYLAAIKTYRLKNKGHVYQLATVYKNGRLILKDYVYKTLNKTGITYASPDDRFALNLNTQSSVNPTAEFKAVIHDRNGATLVSNGQFPCHRQSS